MHVDLLRSASIRSSTDLSPRLGDEELLANTNPGNPRRSAREKLTRTQADELRPRCREILLLLLVLATARPAWRACWPVQRP